MIPVYIFVFLLAGNAVSLEFNPCEEGGQPPNSLYIFGCREQPCQFAPGDNVTGAVNFTVGEDSTDLDGEITLDHKGSLITLPVPGVHICDGLEEEGCRLENGVNANYYFLFQLNTEIPDEDIVSFKMVVKNEKGTSLSCSEFSGKVVGSTAKDKDDAHAQEEDA